jgi:hypothetical protein
MFGDFSMNKIYTAGYQEIKSPELLKQMARERGAVVVDIRFKNTCTSKPQLLWAGKLSRYSNPGPSLW